MSIKSLSKQKKKKKSPTIADGTYIAVNDNGRLNDDDEDEHTPGKMTDSQGHTPTCEQIEDIRLRQKGYEQVNNQSKPKNLKQHKENTSTEGLGTDVEIMT